MTTTLTPIDAARPDFAGLVTDLDLRQPLRPEDVAKVEATTTDSASTLHQAA